jgi:predicted GNAT superfamily acetyltransferase
VTRQAAAETKADAKAAADAAAFAAGVRIRELTDLADLQAACRLFAEIWRPGPANPPLTVELMRALTKAGNYAAGAYDGSLLVGACVGFFGPPADEALHSHIAGVSGAMAGRSVGFALKLHQRAWALCRDVAEIAWTFDPLVRRNAYFNLVKLSARPAEYLPNFYGAMIDAINGAAESDRLLVRWELGSASVAAACAGRFSPASAAAELARGATVALSAGPDGWPVRPVRPVQPDRLVRGAGAPGSVVLVAVPPDIEGLRSADTECAAAWRSAVRDALSPLMAAGALVTGFDKSGWYVVQTQEESR